MVEAGENNSQKPPSASELLEAERLVAMMDAVAKDDEDDYDLEDDDELNDADEDDRMAHEKQRRLLAAALAQQAREYQGMDPDEIEDHEELMRQIYQQNLLMKQEQQNGHLPDMDPATAQLLQLQAEQLAKSGMDPLQALQMLKSQQQFAAQADGRGQMLNAPSCLIGNLPNNLDIDLKDAVLQPGMMNGISGPPLGGMDMGQMQGVYGGQPAMLSGQNQLTEQQVLQHQQQQQQQQQLSLQQQQQQQQTQFKRTSWIQWFSALEGHDFLLTVDRNFLKDKFNLMHLEGELKLAKARLVQCRSLMSRDQGPTDEELQNEQFLALNQDTSDMYGLIHARYIRSPEGLALVYGKYLQGAYGYCPRAFCDKQRVVPNGLSDKLRQNRVKVYCTKCEEMYIPTGTNRLDGAFFGSSLAHVFLQMYSKQVILPPKVYFYEPQLFGFRVAGKRGSKFFTPGASETTDTKERQRRLEADMSNDGSQQQGSQLTQQQGSSATAATSQHLQPPQANKPRNNKSRHRGRKN